MATSAKMEAPRGVIGHSRLKLEQVLKLLDRQTFDGFRGNVGNRRSAVLLDERALGNYQYLFAFNDGFLQLDVDALVVLSTDTSTFSMRSAANPIMDATSV